MAKIKVEFEVPDGKYCKTCGYYRYMSSDFGVCALFGRTILLKRPIVTLNVVINVNKRR